MRNFQDSFEARKPSFTSAISICVSGNKKCSFLENLACFVFLKHPFWNSPFCLITDKMRCTFQSHIQNPVKHLKKRIFFILGRVLNTLPLSARKRKLESFILKLPRFLVVINIVTLAFIFHSFDKLRSHSISKKTTFIVHCC